MIPSTTIRHTPARDLRDDDWRDHAACLDVDPELFFPEGDEWSRRPEQRDAALAICATFPVRQECLDATPRDDRYSIRGGTTPSQRRPKPPAGTGVTDCDVCGQTVPTRTLVHHMRRHEPTCKRGHVIAEVGRGKDRSCNQCRRETQRIYDREKRRRAVA